MSRDPFARDDLSLLRSDGYTLSVENSGYVVVRDVAYVTDSQEVRTDGVLAYPYSEAGPSDHVVFFVGDLPRKSNGVPFGFESGGRWEVADGLVATLQLSAKDPDKPIDANYYVKFSRYLQILGDQAEAIAPGSAAPPFRPVPDLDLESPFEYLDSASSRAGIVEYSRRLELRRVAIVGLGGTGSYILDLVSKTRVGEIHLFDSDRFLSHNAFRAPGAAALEELDALPLKVDYYAHKYSKMKRGIVAHPYNLNSERAAEMGEMDFVFLAMEGGTVKRELVAELEVLGVSFIDASIDVLPMGDGLGGTVQVTTSTPAQRDHLDRRVDFSDPTPDDLYSSNVQVADLNALSAILAVIKWKKLFGFYADRRKEHWSAYSVDLHVLASGDEL